MTKIMMAFALLLALALASCQTQTPTQVETDQGTPQDTVTVAVEEVPLPTITATEPLTAVPTVNPTSETTTVLSLQLELADPDWDGERIPDGQQCQSQGGVNPSTPTILVGDIPEGSDAIILEFSDRSYRPMDEGGHGKIGFMIPEGTHETVIHSVPGHTFDLPKDFFLVHEHLAPGFDTAGAYMPPCSGGANHAYYVTVKSVELISMDDKTFNILGQGILELGEY